MLAGRTLRRFTRQGIATTGLSIVGIQQLLGYCRPFTLTTPKFHGEGEPDSLQQTPIKDWKLGKLNHVAIAVPDLNKATTLYRDTLGAEVSDVMHLPEHGVSTVFISLGNTKIELLHPLGENSPIESFLKKKPDGGLHHICIEVDDIEAALRDLEGKVRPLSPMPKIGAHGKPVVFLHPKDCQGVLVELEES